MKKIINIEGYEVAIEAKIVDAFTRSPLGPIEVCAALYLSTDLGCDTMDEVFEKYSAETIEKVIANAAIEELTLYGVSV